MDLWQYTEISDSTTSIYFCGNIQRSATAPQRYTCTIKAQNVFLPDVYLYLNRTAPKFKRKNVEIGPPQRVIGPLAGSIVPRYQQDAISYYLGKCSPSPAKYLKCVSIADRTLVFRSASLRTWLSSLPQRSITWTTTYIWQDRAFSMTNQVHFGMAHGWVCSGGNNQTPCILHRLAHSMAMAYEVTWERSREKRQR